MQFGIVVPPSRKPHANLGFGALVFVAAFYVGLDQISEVPGNVALRIGSVDDPG